MRLLSTALPPRSFLGSCAFLLLPTAPLLAQDAAWRAHFSLGPSLAHPRFAYARAVPGQLRLPRPPQPVVMLGLARQLTAHVAVGAEERIAGIQYAVRYRYPGPGASTAEIVDGLLYQFGLNTQLLFPIGLRWELGTVVNASYALTALSLQGQDLRGDDASIWQAGSSAASQSLTLRLTLPRQTTLFTGAELRLLYWLGAGAHGLQLSLGHQQGLRTIVRADTREFSYPDATGQRQPGAFGLRLNGSYSSVQLGYCYAWGKIRPATGPGRRWSSPRYSEPVAPPADADTPTADL